MNAESFTALALRVLSREATEEERRTFHEELATDAERREQWEEIQITHEIALTVTAAQAEQPELPAYRVGELQGAVRRHFSAAAREEKAGTAGPSFLRWLFAGGGVAALAAVVVLFCMANQSIEVGFYRSDLVRSGEKPLVFNDTQSAKVVTFDQDAAFDEWQHSLAWYQRGKVWVDNEKNLLHVVRRDAQGNPVEHTEALATTSDEQQDQINWAVKSLRQ